MRPLVFPAMFALAWMFPLADEAQANTCRSLQLQLMQAQASREMNEYRRVQGLLASGCSGRSGGDRQPVARIAPQRERAATPSRQVRQAKPQQARRPVRAEQAHPQQARRQESRPKRDKPRTTVARATYRTVCVRSCDGYYFPISFSTTEAHFEADQAMCAQLCPEAEAGIYYHRHSEGPEQMISQHGEPYTELPVAFSYRSGLNPSCSCGTPNPGGLTASVEGDGSEPHHAEPAQLPRPRVAPGEDPETLANRGGGFVPKSFASTLVAAQAGGQRAVRVVGAITAAPVVVAPVPTNFPFDLGLLAEPPS